MWYGSRINDALLALALIVVMEYQAELLAQLKLAVAALRACGW